MKCHIYLNLNFDSDYEKLYNLCNIKYPKSELLLPHKSLHPQKTPSIFFSLIELLLEFVSTCDTFDLYYICL